MFRRLSSARIRSALGLCVILTSVTGCSSIYRGQSSAVVHDDGSFSQSAPIEVKVSQTFYDRDGKLHVKVLLKPLAELQTAELAVSLVGLKDGVAQIEQTKRLSEVYSEPLVEPNSVIAVQFELMPPEVSEFQVRASWGAEGKEAASNAAVAAQSIPGAVPVAASTQPAPNVAPMAPEPNSPLLVSPQPEPTLTAGALTLRQLRVEERKHDCDEGCQRALTVVVEIQNGSASIVNGATLGVRLVWLNQGEALPASVTGPLRPDEEKISLSSLVLSPGQKRQVRVAIDRELPEVAGGAFLPVVRLVQ